LTLYVLLILHVLLYKYELLYKFANMHCNKLENGYKIVFSTATAGEPTLPTAGAQSTRQCWHPYCRRSNKCAGGIW
jgi:hypothetical protein